jgi:hypothetical protein
MIPQITNATPKEIVIDPNIIVAILSVMMFQFDNENTTQFIANDNTYCSIFLYVYVKKLVSSSLFPFPPLFFFRISSSFLIATKKKMRTPPRFRKTSKRAAVDTTHVLTSTE